MRLTFIIFILFNSFIQVLSAKGLNEKNISHNVPLGLVNPNGIYRPYDPSSFWYELYQNWIEKDHSGILDELKNKVKEWNEKENMVRNYGILPLGYFETPEKKEKERYLKSNLIKYLDKKIDYLGKQKNASKTVQMASKIQNNMKPSFQQHIGKDVELKFKTNIIERELLFSINSTYLNLNSTWGLETPGQLMIEEKVHHFGINSNIVYHFKENIYAINFNKYLTPALSLAFITAQGLEKAPLSNSADKVFGFFYNKSY